jgi:hypothetical protein
MKKNLMLILLLALMLHTSVKSQSLSSYYFSTDSGTFTPLTGATVVWVTGNDVTASTLPIGFNFSYGLPNTSSYSQFCLNSNGWIGLTSNTIPNLVANALPNMISTSYPRIAPLWDDLSIGSGGKISYLTSGSVGNRILTVEWLNMKWYWGASTPVISFQAKLYEANGTIEFIYRQESGAATSNNASIGINNASATDFWCLNPSLSNAIYGTNYNTITTKPATGSIYRWSTSDNLSLDGLYLSDYQPNVFPNPFTNEININFSNISDTINFVTIYNSLGELVYQKNNSEVVFPENYKIETPFQKGVYFVKITTRNMIYTIKAIKG